MKLKTAPAYPSCPLDRVEAELARIDELHALGLPSGQVSAAEFEEKEEALIDEAERQYFEEMRLL